MRRYLFALAAAAVSAFLNTGVAQAAVLLDDDFSSYPVGASYADGQTFGNWTDVFNGFGYQKIVADGGKQWLEQSPKASVKRNETHAALSVSQQSFTAPQVVADYVTVAQLRTPTPKAWEVAWLLWNYTDNTHFYYLALKPNGVELGKEDPAYPGAQRFLATLPTPGFPLGQPVHVQVDQTVNPDGSVTMTVSANGSQVATFTDTERPYASGKVGLYTEDARVRWGHVQVNG